MALIVQQPSHLTLQEYLEYDERSDEFNEFVNGVIYAMTGATPLHNRIAGNIFVALRNQARLPCEVFTHAQKLLVKNDLTENVFLPDVFMTCTESDRTDIFREQPCFIAEVLSPSTERDDRSGKLANYKTIDALETYIVVSQDRRQIEVFERARSWLPRMIEPDEVIAVCGNRARLTAGQIYEEIML